MMHLTIYKTVYSNVLHQPQFISLTMYYSINWKISAKQNQHTSLITSIAKINQMERHSNITFLHRKAFKWIIDQDIHMRV